MPGARRISRRTILKGAGVALALPLLEIMRPLKAVSGALAPGGQPVRLAFVYIPNGVVQNAWTPETVGPGFELPPSLAPLEGVRDSINVLSGLDRTFSGGTGVHAQSGACWLSSSPPTEALDGAFPTNISLDQMAARELGRNTAFPSLELSCNDHSNQKETKYFESISWYGPGYAAGVEKDPRAAFRRLFGDPVDDPARRSVLDAVLDDAQGLRSDLGQTDREKLDEYLESVRAIERRIQIAERQSAERGKPSIDEPPGAPDDRGAYIRLMGDLIVLAFQMDLTRVASLVIDPERWDTPRMYHGVFDTPQNHHVLTHTKGDEALENLKRIDRFHVEQFAYIVDRLLSIPEGEGTLLDHSLIAMGSGMGDGRVHSYQDLPLILAGSGGGRIKTGRHLAYKNTPLANCWLSLLDTVGIDQPRFADSTGPLSELTG